MRSFSGRRDPRLCSIVLAAGESARLGRPKQLLRKRAEPLLVRAVGLAGRHCNGVIVVLGAGHLKLRALLRRRAPRARAVYNRAWRSGLAGSLQTGLAVAPVQARAALILLTDQPDVDDASLGRLVEAWRLRPGRAAAAHYANRPGAPAILPRRLFARIRTLRGDSGARAILRSLDALSVVDMPEAALDIDTPADAAGLAR